MRDEALRSLHEKSSKEKAAVVMRFFKTAKGEYGEGDQFIGVKVPEIRVLVKKYKSIPLAETEEILRSPIHEERLFALLLLVQEYQDKHTTQAQREAIYSLYVNNKAYVNNWDLVDLSAHNIMGNFLFEHDRSLLYTLVRSSSLWDRRIAIMTTFYFIRQNDFSDTLALSELLLHDIHDLIHKAVGWMLREIGNRDLDTELHFLDRHTTQMPRTMLRYAIEKFDEPLRLHYLKMGK